MIKVDENKCIGCGACIAIAPDTYDFNEKGLSVAISQEITESAKEAADACPVAAIEINVSENNISTTETTISENATTLNDILEQTNLEDTEKEEEPEENLEEVA